MVALAASVRVSRSRPLLPALSGPLRPNDESTGGVLSGGGGVGFPPPAGTTIVTVPVADASAGVGSGAVLPALADARSEPLAGADTTTVIETLSPASSVPKEQVDPAQLPRDGATSWTDEPAGGSSATVVEGASSAPALTSVAT